MGGRWAVAALATALAVPAAAIAAILVAGTSDSATLQLGPPSGTPTVGSAGRTQSEPVGLRPVGPAVVGPPAPTASTTAATPSTAASATADPVAARTATAAARGGSRTLAPGARVGTADRRLSFVAPQGWQYGRCPQGGESCVEIAPTRLGSGDAIDVLVTAQAPGDATAPGTPDEWSTSGGRLTVAGRPARRLDLRSNASVLVYGELATPGQRFMVSCRYDQQEQLLRQACDQVVRTLQLAG